MIWGGANVNKNRNKVCNRTFLVARLVKNLPAMWKTWIWFLGWEDPLKKGMGTHFSNLAWRIPWTEEPGRVQSMGSRRVSKDWATFTFTKLIINVMYLNHPETTPLHLNSWKNCLPRNWSLVPKGWGPLLYRKIGVITNLQQTLTVFCYRSLIPNIRLASRLMQCVCVCIPAMALLVRFSRETEPVGGLL